MLARCRGAFFLFFLPLLFVSTGCRNKTDVVEMELRNREQLYRDLLEEQRRSEGRILALQLEIESLRKGARITPEQAASTYGLKRIVLGRSTGGFDHDGLPGDELLQVVVEPRDYDDHAIKAPGTLQIYALEITPQGVKTPLCMWDISAEQLRQSWKQGLLSTGYTLTLPWKQFPVNEQVRVVVRFVTPDERVYETDKDIKVRVVPGAAQKRMPEMMPMPHPMPAPEAGPLLVPTGRVTSSSPPPTRTQWCPLGPERDVTIGRPTPIDAP
jgi:hypothetical protein